MAGERKPINLVDHFDALEAPREAQTLLKNAA